jgi:hypothetical protein
MKSQGLSLADIAKLHEDVKIGPAEDQFVRIHGISAKVALTLINKYPAVLTKALQGGGLKFGDMVKAAPDVLSAIIVAGTGRDFNDDEELENAGELPIEVQMDILEAIGRLTFKSGFGPFVNRIVALSEAVQSANLGKVPDMKSPQESNSL